MATTIKKKTGPGRGGSRPGAGRKPLEGSKLETALMVRVSNAQKETFAAMGGSLWLRNLLDLGAAAAGPALIGHAAPSGKRVGLPLADDTVQAGFPSPAENYSMRDIDLNDLLVENAPATFLLRVRGDSMIDAGIAEGDLLVVDRSREPRIGDIVVMQVNNEFTVKRLCREGRNGVYLHAENASGLYPDIHPADGDEWKCFGVVRHSIKSL